MQLNTKTAIEVCRDFAEEIKSRLGYDTVYFNKIVITGSDGVTAEYSCYDDFQSKIEYKHWCNYGTRTFAYPPRITDEYNREERELRVLLSQQGESTAMADELVSAAGRKFVDNLMAERAKYAALVDFTKGRS